MTGIILLNGEPYTNTIPKNKGDIVVCCDGAYNWAKDKIKIDKILGDFDSLDFTPEDALVFPTEKNSTDGELAVEYLSDKCRRMLFYGGGGGREDHFLGNLSLLYLSHKKGIEAVMINNKSTIFISSGNFYGQGKTGNVLSLVPFSDKVHINESTGLKYPLNKLKLNKFSTRAISNELLGENFFISIKKGTALIILNKEF